MWSHVEHFGKVGSEDAVGHEPSQKIVWESLVLCGGPLGLLSLRKSTWPYLHVQTCKELPGLFPCPLNWL